MMPHKQNRLSSTFAGQATISQSQDAELIIEKAAIAFC
jgi:hypothetical protein